jgi:hypothetical protein
VTRDEVDELARPLKEMIALIRRRHAAELEPYERRLADLYGLLPNPVITVTEAELHALGVLRP